MKKIYLLILMCFALNFSFGQNWGLGVKLGDPLGVSVKKYNGDKALEFILGRAYYWGGYKYDYHFYHDNRYKNKGYHYLGAHSYSTPLCFQVHYLIHKDIKSVDG